MSRYKLPFHGWVTRQSISLRDLSVGVDSISFLFFSVKEIMSTEAIILSSQYPFSSPLSSDTQNELRFFAEITNLAKSRKFMVFTMNAYGNMAMLMYGSTSLTFLIIFL